MSKIYEIMTTNQDRVLIFVDDGNSVDDVFGAYYGEDIENGTLECDEVSDVYKSDFGKFGDDLYNENGDVIGSVIEEELIIQAFASMSLEDMVAMLMGRHKYIF